MKGRKYILLMFFPDKTPKLNTLNTDKEAISRREMKRSWYLSFFLLDGVLLLGGLSFLVVALELFFFLDGHTGVLHKSGNLFLEEFHVLRKLGKGEVAGLTVFHAFQALLASTLETAVVNTVSDDEGENDSHEGSQYSQSLGSVGEQVGKSKEEQRNEEEHDNNVNDGETTPDSGSLAELTCGMKRNVPHNGERIPNQDTCDVEEKMGKCNLEGVGTFGDERCHECSHGGTNVGSQSEGQHLLETENTHTDEGGKSGGSNGRRLDDHRDSSSKDNTQVSVDVGGLVNDTSRGTQKHLLEDSDESKETEEEDTQRDDEDNKSRELVIVAGGFNLEEGGAKAGGLVAIDETTLGAGTLGGVLRIGTVDGVKVRARTTLGDGLDNFLVGDDNSLTQRCNEFLDWTFPLLTACSGCVLDHGSGETVQVTDDNLNGEEGCDCHKVEHIVNGGTGEGTFQLGTVTQVSKGNNGVGYGSTDVGTHYHEDSLTDTNSVGTDKGNNDGGGGRGGLQQDCCQNTDH